MANSYNELFGLGTYSEDAGIEGWWKLQDDAANTTVVDSSSNALNGTLNGGDNTATITTTGPGGYLPKCLHLNATDDFIEMPFSSVLGSKTGMTFLCHANLDTRVDNKVFFSNWGSSTGQVLCRHGATGTLEFFTNNTTQNGGTLSPSTALTTATWQHVAFRFDSGTRHGFIDGTSDSTTSGGTTFLATTVESFHIGASPHTGPGDFFDGKLANAAVFSRALTDAEIDQHKRGPEPLNTVAPTISGTETEGQLLTCTTGTWDSQLNGTLSYTYQWTRSNDAGGTGEANIGGATSSTYTLVTADAGKFVRCLVRGMNNGDFDSAEDTNSNMSGAIAAASGSSVPVFVHHYAQMQRR